MQFCRCHFRKHLLEWKCIWISIKISLMFVPKVNNIPALVQIMAWRRPGDKPLSESIMVSLLTHICVTRPQWVNSTLSFSFSVPTHKVNTIPADALSPGHQKLWYHPNETFPVCLMVIFWEYSGNSEKCWENLLSPRADTGTTIVWSFPREKSASVWSDNVGNILGNTAHWGEPHDGCTRW